MRLALLVGLLLVTLAAAVYIQRAPSPGGPPVDRADPAPQATSGSAQAGPPDVRIEELTTPRPAPVTAGRNPFRIQAPRPVTAPAPAAPALGPIPQGPVVAAPPSVPPIPLKFIGLVNKSGGKIAVLSDGRFVHHGREGDVLEGRYRIIRIGEESIELEHVDGRGRQTIRLSGS